MPLTLMILTSPDLVSVTNIFPVQAQQETTNAPDDGYLGFSSARGPAFSIPTSWSDLGQRDFSFFFPFEAVC